MTTKATREKQAPSSLPKGQLGIFGTTADMNGEAWIGNRLTEWHGVPDVFGGVATPEERKQRIRAAIVAHGLEWVICARDATTRSNLTWGEVFKRKYGEAI